VQVLSQRSNVQCTPQLAVQHERNVKKWFQISWLSGCQTVFMSTMTRPWCSGSPSGMSLFC